MVAVVLHFDVKPTGMGIADTSSDSDDPINQYILKPASQRLAGSSNGAADETDSTASARQAKSKKPKRSPKSPKGRTPGPAPADPAQPRVSVAINKEQQDDDSEDEHQQPGTNGTQQQVHEQPAKPQTQQQQPQQQQPVSLTGGVVGARVLEDDEVEQQAQNIEMMKLLRGPRYFDVVYEPKGVSCWRCGKKGHVSANCPLEKAKPCVLCAVYGHDSAECPQRKCVAGLLAVLQGPRKSQGHWSFASAW
jgi:hypothetical protein